MKNIFKNNDKKQINNENKYTNKKLSIISAIIVFALVVSFFGSYIDLVVSDIMMPDMDGIELCRYMKTKFEYRPIPVILVTAKRAEESQIEGYNSGADGYISKPCNFSLLYAQIMNCLKRQERKGADFRKQIVFEVGKLEYTSLDETFLQRAIDCVNARLSDADFDQAEFVSEMGTSRSVLTEKLKSLTGLTPSAFVQNVRLTAACKLMDEQGKIRISDSYRHG